MKTLTILMLATSAFAQTNIVIDLQHRQAAFTNLHGRTYVGQLLTADLDGIVYMMADGTSRNKVWFTNLSPSTLESLGIPTNRIEMAKQRSIARIESNHRYETAVAVKRQQINEDSDAKLAAAGEWAKIEAVNKAKTERLGAIKAQIELIQQLQIERDRAWDRYIDTPSDVWFARNGVAVDSESIRRATARQADRDLVNAKEKLVQLQRVK